MDRSIAPVNATGRLKPALAGVNMSRCSAVPRSARLGAWGQAVLAGRIATDIAGYRSGGARLHYRLIGVIWRFADKSAKWMRKRCRDREDLSRSAQQMSATGVIQPCGWASSRVGCAT